MSWLASKASGYQLKFLEEEVFGDQLEQFQRVREVWGGHFVEMEMTQVWEIERFAEDF